MKESLIEKLSWKRLIKLAVAVALLGTIVVLYLLREKGLLSIELAEQLLKENPILAPVIFVLIYTFMPLFLIPTIPMNVLAGFFWGGMVGFIYTMIGSVAGSVLPFFISRYLASDLVNRIIARFTSRTLSRLKKSNWKIVGILRLNPIFPSPFLSYFFGVTSIGFGEYILATILFSIPPAMALALLGDSFRNLAESGGLMIGIITLLGALTILAILWVFKPHILQWLNKGEAENGTS